MRNLTFIGDIHAAADDLQALLADPVIAASQLIFLGDYIDGISERDFTDHVEYSPIEPLKTLALVQERVDKYHDVALLGNHDDFWLQTAQKNNFIYRTWEANGGLATWRKLGLQKTDLASIVTALNQPPLLQYTRFLQQLPLTWTNSSLFAVHAGIHWGGDLQQQRRDDLLWIRDDYFLANPDQPRVWHRNKFGKIIISGHTPVQTLIGHGFGYLKMQANAHDIPRYLIDAGSRSGAYDGGIFGLTLTPSGHEVQKKWVIKEKLYDGDQFITEAMVSK